MNPTLKLCCRQIAACLVAGLCLLSARDAANADGAMPYATLIQAKDGSLYGTTQHGGAYFFGSVYKITTTGVLKTIYSFKGLNDGAYPQTSLVQAGDGYLYGTTYQAGSGGTGTVFRLSTAGGLKIIHSFSASTGSPYYINQDGAYPTAALIQAKDGFLYGTTLYGGANGTGVVFKLSTTGAFSTLYSFNAVPSSLPRSNIGGASPYAGLVQAADGNLYGTAEAGGAQGYGAVFKISTGGSLTTLYSFSGSDGSYPTAGLVQGSDGNLYGTTQAGGSTTGDGNGTIFKITTGGALTTLHTFSYADGVNPYAGLIQANDGSFYGTAQLGGANSSGSIFKIATTGAFSTLYSFSQLTVTYPQTNSDGAHPYAGLVQAADGNLYGTTHDGAAYAKGTVFRISTGGSFSTLHAFIGAFDGSYPTAGLTQATNGSFYGASPQGGENGTGVIYKLSSQGALTTLYSFSAVSGGYPSTNPEGATPYSGLIQASDGKLYGTASEGGSSGDGTIFRVTTQGVVTAIHAFNGSDGGYPTAGLIQASDSNLYGTTDGGGQNGSGTVFKITTAGAFTTLYSFTKLSASNPRTNSDGAEPGASLIQGADGNLYGSTQAGGQYGYGTVFKITPQGVITTLYSFTGGLDGGIPNAVLQASDGNLYGATRNEGAYNYGTVFRITTAGALTTLYTFGSGGSSDGAYPWSGMIQAGDGNLYGTTQGGGYSGDGAIFQISTAGALTIFHSFSAGDGSRPTADLIRGKDGDLYSTTQYAGANGQGTVFKITPKGVLITLHAFGSY